MIIKPKLSIICITHNHERYVEDALKGFVMQKTNFPYEILISDDYSTDKTGELIKKYQNQYKNLIKYYPRKRNIGIKKNLIDLWMKSSSKYVALCEGDDYWSDENKLQIQYDYLESNLNCTVCFHPVSVINDENIFLDIFPKEITEDDINLRRLVKSNFISTNSVVYRKIDHLEVDPGLSLAEIMPLDWYLHILHAKKGEIGFIPRVMSTYRRHADGVWSSIADNPTLLFRKWGNEHIEFFRQLRRMLNKEFKKDMQKNMEYIFKTMYFDFYSRARVAELNNLIKLNPDINIHSLTKTSGNSADNQTTSKNLSLVSTIVITYNHEIYIEKCLQSLILQVGFFKQEIIIIDDCSIDKTASVIENFIKKLKNKDITFKFLRRDKNCGLQANLRHGINSATGKYIAFCEGDDYWISPFKIAKQIAYLLENQNVDMCFSKVLLDDELNGIFYPHPLTANIVGKFVSFDQLIKEDLTANFSCCLYRANAIKKIPKEYYSFKNSANWLLNLIISSYGYIGFINEILSAYRIHENGAWSGLKKSGKEKIIQETYSHLLLINPQLKIKNLTHPKRKKISQNINSKPDKIKFYSDEYIIHIDKIEKIYNSLSIAGWISKKNNSKSYFDNNLFITLINDQREILLQELCTLIKREDVISHLIQLDNFKDTEICSTGFNANLIINLDRKLNGQIALQHVDHIHSKFVDTKCSVIYENLAIQKILREVE